MSQNNFWMLAEDVRHPEKQPKSSKGDEKKYKKQRKKQKREGRSSVPGRESLFRDKFPNTSKPSHCQIYAEPWKHRGQHNMEEK